jgi:hypothetical protein
MYELSFSGDFFTGTEQIEDIQPSYNSKSCLQALISWSVYNPNSFKEMIKNVLSYESKIVVKDNIYYLEYIPDHIFYELLNKIHETNTCYNLNNPVLVYIDKNHEYSIYVY